jgi:hypothetical protein
LNTYGFHSSKGWFGNDGRYFVAPKYPKMPKWNSYLMGSVRSRMLGPPTCNNNYCSALETGSFGSYCWNFSALYSGWCRDIYANIDSPQARLEFDSLWSATEEILLRAKLLRTVKDSSFNAGVSLAEVDKFAGSVVKTIKNVGLGAVDLMSGRYSNFARRFANSPPTSKKVRKLNLTDVPGRFLEMQYCWLPAYQDIFAFSDAFNEISRGPRKHLFRVSRSVKSSEVNPSTFPHFPDRIVEAHRTYLYEAYEELDFYRQIGLGNPASILWERIPYSFLVDWFIPIGTYLEVIGQVPFLKGRFLRTSVLKKSVNGVITSTDPTRTLTCSTSVSSSAFWMERTPLGALQDTPFPNLTVHGAVQGRRVLNAAALASLLVSSCVSAFSKRGPRSPESLVSDVGISRLIKLLSPL